jgi:hypothetical protein
MSTGTNSAVEYWRCRAALWRRLALIGAALAVVLMPLAIVGFVALVKTA